MCGIMGYTGYRQALPLLLEGLKRLEYRGYDSAGVAVLEEGSLFLQKKAGKIAVLEACLNGFCPSGKAGIGHTRWATHGAPCDHNAHPHLDCRGEVAVVHNGIIENYASLRAELVKRGHRFLSETDTEVIPHLLEEAYEGDLLSTLRKVLPRLHGSYALAALSVREPGRLVVARRDSPLVLGLGEGENFLASDIPALLPYTRRTYILEDGELAEIWPDGIKVYDAAGRPLEKKVFHVKWDAAAAEKAPYPHFMLKEIHEQPRALRDTLRGRIEGGRVVFPELEEAAFHLRECRRLFLTACGTAFHAGLVGKYLLEKLARLPVEADIASEFRYRDLTLGPGDVVLVISQSGETADTLAALRLAKEKGAKVLAITNVVGSSVAREADWVLYTWAGPEIAVASTKAYTAQVLLVTLLALYLAELRGTLPSEEIIPLVEEVKFLPERVAQVLAWEEEIARLAQALKEQEHFFFIGRGLDWAVAEEGALKLKEISYIHAEAYPAGELKHGTLALITEGVPVVALATQSHLFEKMLSNIKEVKARGAWVLALTADDQAVAGETDVCFHLPPGNPLLMPAVAVVPLQLLAYYVAVARGCDVDQPRNLAKSVTVE
ncbi:glucosamine/fructose-6-phosphate aminotransferase, isomerizing [Ammonifex degensii KC4]|uniref:Glutamine--fructose-6-phosphate aminotransferase [isomerizing] n=1 Tax=Ammonifex degensii (strain DSM 10501 / KC4) TaxID=429009 RepID=C9RAX4_AMMDK|nr:glutamine--fructose-6-phosphate transaminase (isomerizing) [Ammonifex degensii]ACX51401.1 glucosamine/fructose-6-phosphate aminotransferase, isomerizing [Ammonifex degensii KC4]